MEPSSCNIKTRIAFAITGVLVGVSIFFSFGLVFKNWDTAAFGLVSGVFAGVTLYCHIRWLQDGWKRAPDMLQPLMMTGCFVQLIGVVAFAVYLVLAITEKQELTPYGPRGYYLTCVWCFMTWKWGFVLFYFTRQYRNLYRQLNGVSSEVGYERIPGNNC